jgi:ABC-type transport system substrate-binding protein
MKKYFIPFFVWFASLVFSLSPASAAEPVRGGTLIIGYPENADRLDGHRIRSGGVYWFTTGTLYNGLVTADDKHNVIPDLARSWDIKEGGRVWDFRLHEGVKFHDGSELTAEVVKWNFERARDPKVAWADKSDFEDILDRVEAVDKYTARFHLKKPSTNFHVTPLATGGRSLPMVSKQAVEKWGFKDFDTHPVGTGPFKFAEWVRDDHITLVRNENYFKKGLPHLDKVVIKILQNPNTRFSALRAGEVQMMFDIPPEMVPMIQKTPGVTYVKSKPCSYVWLILNAHPEAEKVGAGFFKDLRVRRAINLAIDREELVRLVVPEGMGVPAYGGPLPTGSPYYHKVDWVKYDPEKARQLLKEAGVPNLKFKLETNNSKGRFVRALEVIKEQLSRIGVETEITVFDKAAHFPRSRTSPPQWHGFLEDYEFSLDPSSYLYRYYGRGAVQNYNNWYNEECDRLLLEGMVEGDFEKRKKIYDRAQEIIVDDVVRIFLWYGVEDLAYTNKLKGYVFTRYYNSRRLEKAYFEK